MADLLRSPLAPDSFPALPPIDGVRVGAAETGIRYKGRPDLFVAECRPGSTIGGALTRSLTRSAPVDWCARQLAHGRVRAIVANAGNANAFTGRLGDEAVAATVKAAAAAVGCAAEEVFVASTGVIGEPLPYPALTAALPAAVPALAPGRWTEAAAAIMTTDTFPKGATATAEIGGRRVTINGIAKGSGMIAPDMATMLAFLFTDAAIPAPALDRLAKAAVDRSFNSITVDSDTSTSDTVLVAASGAAGNAPAEGDALAGFATALDAVMIDLARQVVADGEGATKFITIAVTGAESAAAARRIGLAIGNSPLVKTAIAGEDANWGRIVMAVGKSGERADRDRLAIRIGGVLVAAEGRRVDGFDEAPVARHIKGRQIQIDVDVGVGTGSATVWTCDLTKRYIDINAGYRS